MSHNNTTNAVNNNRFVNPYNFVSLPKETPTKIPIGKRSPKDSLTGVIKCSLKTVTPLAIPDSERAEEDSKKHKTFPFFKVGDEYRIPGSTLRGVMRSVFEAATNSCMSVINTNILSARHPFPRQAGLIKYNKDTKQWELFKAEKYMLNAGGKYSDKGEYYKIIKDKEKWHINFNGSKYYTGSKINFTLGDNYMRGRHSIGTVVKNLGGNEEGYLLLWSDIFNKHHNSIFVLKNDEAIDCVNLKKAVENFKEVCDIYKKHDKAEDEKAPNSYEKIVYELKTDGEYYPVWYEEVEVKDNENNTHVYLSPSCISRSVFDKRLEDLIGEHKKCDGRDKLCPACLLFGMVADSKDKKSLGSSLRFSDAVAEDSKNISLGKIPLKILSSPKPSSVEFYTQRPPKALVWNYDYITIDYEKDKENKDIPKRKLTKIKIKGRKFYLHNTKVNSNRSLYSRQNNITDNQNATIELVKPKSIFKFDVYFENITLIQLQNLVWVLTFGENDIDGKRCHKMGHGKPLGLGSVKVEVDSVTKRSVQVKIKENKVVFEEEQKDISKLLKECEINAPDELLKIADIDFTKDANVSYPMYMRDDEPSYKWFGENRKAGELPNGDRVTGMKLVIHHTLKSIAKAKNAEVLSLPTDPYELPWEESNVESEQQPPAIDNSKPKYEKSDKPKFIRKKIEEAIKKVKEQPRPGPVYKNLLKDFLAEIDPTDPEWQDLYKKADELRHKL